MIYIIYLLGINTALVKLKLLSWKSDFGCLSICGPGGGFRVMFVFRLNLKGKLRFMVNSV